MHKRGGSWVGRTGSSRPGWWIGGYLPVRGGCVMLSDLCGNQYGPEDVLIFAIGGQSNAGTFKATAWSESDLGIHPRVLMTVQTTVAPVVPIIPARNPIHLRDDTATANASMAIGFGLEFGKLVAEA